MRAILLATLLALYIIIAATNSQDAVSPDDTVPGMNKFIKYNFVNYLSVSDFQTNNTTVNNKHCKFS